MELCCYKISWHACYGKYFKNKNILYIHLLNTALHYLQDASEEELLRIRFNSPFKYEQVVFNPWIKGYTLKPSEAAHIKVHLPATSILPCFMQICKCASWNSVVLLFVWYGADHVLPFPSSMWLLCCGSWPCAMYFKGSPFIALCQSFNTYQYE